MNTCALDCPCGCEGISGTNGCTCATSCACGTTSNTWNIWYNNNNSPTISLGDIVVWTNSYSSKHTVSSDEKFLNLEIYLMKIHSNISLIVSENLTITVSIIQLV